MSEVKFKAAFWIFLAAITLFRLWYNTTLELHPDEAYYWQWSQHLAGGYYDQGPMMAWLIAFSTGLMGHSEFSVRMVAVAFSTGISWLLYRLARDLYHSERAGFLAALFLNVVPLGFVSGTLATYDAVQIFCWLLALVLILNVFRTGKGHLWIWTGIVFGLGMLSKYTMVLLLPAIFLTLLAIPSERRWLLRPEPYLGLLAAALVFSPCVIWSARNDWASVHYLLLIGGKNPKTFLQAGTLVDFIGSQLVVLTPFLGIAALTATVREARRAFKASDASILLMSLACLATLAYFTLHSLNSKIEANWPSSAYPSALALLGGVAHRVFSSDTPGWRRKAGISLYIFSVAFAVVLLGFALFPGMFQAFGVNLPAKIDRTNECYGWSKVAQEAIRVRQRMPRPQNTFIAGGTYQNASELAFYTQKEVPYLRLPGRRTAAYDFWDLLSPLTGKDAVFTDDAYRGDATSQLVRYFEKVETGPTVPVFRPDRYRDPIRVHRFYRCFGFKGFMATRQEAP